MNESMSFSDEVDEKKTSGYLKGCVLSGHCAHKYDKFWK